MHFSATSKAWRRAFIEYFINKGHTAVPSSPVVPHDDPTILFTNAGMNQFKDIFLGKVARPYPSAVSSQTCVRVGGKHNDLDNVGHTSRHLTFFEMLGNFSFGDYFKEQAIAYAWEVATEVFGFESEKIYPSVFVEDEEAFSLWCKYVPSNRISRMGEKDNFWAMGPVGPCGPCSELYYDRGPEYGEAKSPLEDTKGERFIEFWNLVFMQLEREESGIMRPLPSPSIDTGAGLERLLMLKTGVNSLFETDVLRTLIQHVEETVKIPYRVGEKESSAFRVIADHVRTLSFAIKDGVLPSNTERGYVLRKLLRRAVRYGRMLKMDTPFLSVLVDPLVNLMGEDFAGLQENREWIKEVLFREEELFLKTLRRGGALLKDVVEGAQDGILKGKDAFLLKDTYGFPYEEIALFAKDHHLKIDETEYRRLEEEARALSKRAQKKQNQISHEMVFSFPATVFEGYTKETLSTSILGIYAEGEIISSLPEGEEGQIFLSKTPFYAEMGGQVGDTGEIVTETGVFKVTDTKQVGQGYSAHHGFVERGHICLQQAKASIDKERRAGIRRAHTATHLLHHALSHILGKQTRQAGSLVEENRLRFDFTSPRGLKPEEIEEIEIEVNKMLWSNQEVSIEEKLYKEVQEMPEIRQFFGEKYGEKVRVVKAGPTMELCGGTHVASLGDIGYFRIEREGSIGSGIRRIEAFCGPLADQYVRSFEKQIGTAAALLKTMPSKLMEGIQGVLKKQEEYLEKIAALESAERKRSLAQAEALLVGEDAFLCVEASLGPASFKVLAGEAALQDSERGVICYQEMGDKLHLLVQLPEKMAKKVPASKLIKAWSTDYQGSGGGKDNFAQGVFTKEMRKKDWGTLIKDALTKI